MTLKERFEEGFEEYSESCGAFQEGFRLGYYAALRELDSIPAAIAMMLLNLWQEQLGDVPGYRGEDDDYGHKLLNQAKTTLGSNEMPKDVIT